MSLSRRSFLTSVGAGTAAAALQIPFIGASIAVARTAIRMPRAANFQNWSRRSIACPSSRC